MTEISKTSPDRVAVISKRPASVCFAIPWRIAFSTRCCQRETRNGRGHQRFGNSELRSQAIGETRLLDRHVLPHEIELFAERDFVCLVASQRASQQFAEMFDDADGALSIVVTNEHRDRVECVEEKVRIELCLKCGEARARELFGEPCDLHFTLARVDEVTCRVLDTDDAEIHRYAERQRREDPAQPFDTENLTGSR